MCGTMYHAGDLDIVFNKLCQSSMYSIKYDNPCFNYLRNPSLEHVDIIVGHT